MKNLVMGMSALALIFVVGLTSCAYEVKSVKDTPVEQRASLYLITDDSDDTRIVKLDGQGLGLSGIDREGPNYRGKFWDTFIVGTNSRKTTNNRITRSMQVTPGEHTITLSGKVLIGRKNFDGTFNFEPGKKYMIMLATQGLLNSMLSPGFSGMLGDLGSHLKDSLAGNYIVILAESKREDPRYPDGRIERVKISANDTK